MCGRFVRITPGAVLAEQFQLSEVPALEPRYNIAPTQPVAVVRLTREDATRKLVLLRWGLIPSWAKDPSIGSRMINARSETVAEKPSFRSAFKSKRCLVPADGFYEWQRQERAKQPFFIRMREGTSFAIAGLWEHWQGPGGEVIESCTLLTTTPNEVMRPLHDRMPVILDPKDYELWLDPDIQKGELLLPLLQPYAADAMLAYPVRPVVNSPANDSPLCIEPLS